MLKEPMLKAILFGFVIQVTLLKFCKVFIYPTFSDNVVVFLMFLFCHHYYFLDQRLFFPMTVNWSAWTAWSAGSSCPPGQPSYQPQQWQKYMGFAETRELGTMLWCALCQYLFTSTEYRGIFWYFMWTKFWRYWQVPFVWETCNCFL